MFLWSFNKYATFYILVCFFIKQWLTILALLSMVVISLLSKLGSVSCFKFPIHCGLCACMTLHFVHGIHFYVCHGISLLFLSTALSLSLSWWHLNPNADSSHAWSLGHSRHAVRCYFCLMPSMYHYHVLVPLHYLASFVFVFFVFYLFQLFSASIISKGDP
jgi:hypothetical protein